MDSLNSAWATFEPHHGLTVFAPLLIPLPNSISEYPTYVLPVFSRVLGVTLEGV